MGLDSGCQVRAARNGVISNILKLSNVDKIEKYVFIDIHIANSNFIVHDTKQCVLGMNGINIQLHKIIITENNVDSF